MGRAKKVDDEQILREIAISRDPVVTAPELAETLDYSVDGVRNRLRDLESEGFVDSREVGARAVIWWITSTGRKRLANS